MINNKKYIEGMRRACKLAAEVLEETGNLVREGISTLELNDFANDLTVLRGATSAPYLYKINPWDTPFPKHICTSINNVVCHGIPKSSDILKDGDIINIDITVNLNGYHGDTSKTFLVGSVSNEDKELVKTAEQAMFEGIEAIRPNSCISSIGKAIEKFISKTKFSIVRELTGHGIGKNFHDEPHVFHYHNKWYKKPILPFMTFTVEPMINAGNNMIKMLNDKWTIVTVDGKKSAQFEHTVLVTPKGFEILTLM